jgi:hypothetical protein
MERTAYLLSLDFNSQRTIFSKNILEKIGLKVLLIEAIKNDNPVLSNKISIQHILKLIIENNLEWNYIFEDDINLIENISLNEIIQYEKISNKFFYLGCCLYGNCFYKSNHIINNHIVYKVYDKVRGFHAIGLNKQGATQLLQLSYIYNDFSKDEHYMDVILEKYCRICHSNVIRLDLESKCEIGHRGIFFQDRLQFKSSIPEKK